MKSSLSWNLVTLIISFTSIPTLAATILECKVNNPVANAYCGDYCESLNPGNHVAGSCAKDEVSCLCEMSNNKTIKVRVLQDQEPAPYMPEPESKNIDNLQRLQPAQPMRLQPIPMLQPPKNGQRLICDGSQIATITCNSFCINAVRGSGGNCNVQDHTCRCINVQFITNEPIEAVYIPGLRGPQNPHGNVRPNVPGQQKFGTEFNRLQKAPPFQLKPVHQFQSPLVNIVPSLVQQPFMVHPQPPQSFYQNVPLPNNPQEFQPQFYRPSQPQQYMDRPQGSQIEVPFNQQQSPVTRPYLQQIPHPQMTPQMTSSFEPSPGPITPTFQTPVPQLDIPSETPLQFLDTESVENSVTSQTGQHLSGLAADNSVPTVEHHDHTDIIEPATEIPETTISPSTSTTAKTVQPQTTTPNSTLFSPPPFLYGWQGMPMRKMTPLKRVQREPLCTAASCAKHCVDLGFASCQSICSAETTCRCLCSNGSSSKNSAT